jgi:hypothetical protein
LNLTPPAPPPPPPGAPAGTTGGPPSSQVNQKLVIELAKALKDTPANIDASLGNGVEISVSGGVESNGDIIQAVSELVGKSTSDIIAALKKGQNINVLYGGYMKLDGSNLIFGGGSINNGKPDPKGVNNSKEDPIAPIPTPDYTTVIVFAILSILAIIATILSATLF